MPHLSNKILTLRLDDKPDAYFADFDAIGNTGRLSVAQPQRDSILTISACWLSRRLRFLAAVRIFSAAASRLDGRAQR